MNYIAYTIGPIYDTIFDTLNDTNKTKKLKAGSYFFSYFMKKLLTRIKDDFEILVPALSENEYKNMGLYHDRFIASFENISKEKAKEIFEEKLQKTYDELTKEIDVNIQAKDLEKNFDNHLIIADNDELTKVDENIIFALNKILDSMELQRDFDFEIEKNYIKEYQTKQIEKLGKVKTLEQIAGDFSYYAVITADGDKMGQKIKNEATENPQNIKEISKKLFDFFTDEPNIYEITNKEFGGELIYAGGDDILAFLPVKYKDKTFFDYIDTLDSRFKEKVGDDVSLSFGVNIVYQKYPLREAIEKAFELLHNAKESASNSVAIHTTKHSGQYFSTILNLKDETYTGFKELTREILQNDITLPHSIHHSLSRYKFPVIESFKNEYSSIEEFFKTVFNDTKEESDRKGIDKLKEYLIHLKPKDEKAFDEFFSQLSIIKFLREDRKV